MIPAEIPGFLLRPPAPGRPAAAAAPEAEGGGFALVLEQGLELAGDAETEAAADDAPELAPVDLDRMAPVAAAARPDAAAEPLAADAPNNAAGAGAPEKRDRGTSDEPARRGEAAATARDTADGLPRVEEETAGRREPGTATRDAAGRSAPPAPVPTPPTQAVAAMPGLAAAAPGQITAAAGAAELAAADAAPGWRLGVGTAAAAAARGLPTPPAPVVTGQIAVAIRTAERDRIEIRLDPPELGRVQIEMRVHDGGALQALLIAERPEVHELLRRHAEFLERELEAAGYTGVTLDFAAAGQERPDPQEEWADRAALDAGPVSVIAKPRPTPDGRLDIRL